MLCRCYDALPCLRLVSCCAYGILMSYRSLRLRPPVVDVSRATARASRETLMVAPRQERAPGTRRVLLLVQPHFSLEQQQQQ
jgi:hypothetical protein